MSAPGPRRDSDSGGRESKCHDILSSLHDVLTVLHPDQGRRGERQNGRGAGFARVRDDGEAFLLDICFNTSEARKAGAHHSSLFFLLEDFVYTII